MPPKRTSASSSTPSPTPPRSTHTPSSAAAASTPSKRPPPSTSSFSSSSSSNQSAAQIAQSILTRYQRETPQRTKLLDAFLAFLLALGGVQFVYCVLAGNYPFNAFLSGFSATVGQFILTASLRMQTNPANASEFPRTDKGTGGGDERAFADYVFGSLLLHVLCVNFIN